VAGALEHGSTSYPRHRVLFLSATSGDGVVRLFCLDTGSANAQPGGITHPGDFQSPFRPSRTGSPVVVLAGVAELAGWWDGVRLEGMLANLIGNALKYNRQGRLVVVTVQRAGESAVLSVADQGVGIPAAELPRVFERGYRASNVAAEVDGCGLGLASVRDTVVEHGGAIEVESQERVARR
jgi:signal transduction histidine kinase